MFMRRIPGSMQQHIELMRSTPPDYPGRKGTTPYE